MGWRERAESVYKKTYLVSNGMLTLLDSLVSLLGDVTGSEQAEDGRDEMPRSPTLTAAGNAAVTGSSRAERSSTSSDSAAVGSCTITDHNVNDRHATDELTSEYRTHWVRSTYAKVRFFHSRLISR